MGPLAETLAASVVCVGMYWRYRISQPETVRWASDFINEKTSRLAWWLLLFCSLASCLMAGSCHAFFLFLLVALSCKKTIEKIIIFLIFLV